MVSRVLRLLGKLEFWQESCYVQWAINEAPKQLKYPWKEATATCNLDEIYLIRKTPPVISRCKVNANGLYVLSAFYYDTVTDAMLKSIFFIMKVKVLCIWPVLEFGGTLCC